MGHGWGKGQWRSKWQVERKKWMSRSRSGLKRNASVLKIQLMTVTNEKYLVISVLL